jgi:hypothetical protein
MTPRIAVDLSRLAATGGSEPVLLSGLAPAKSGGFHDALFRQLAKRYTYLRITGQLRSQNKNPLLVSSDP